MAHVALVFLSCGQRSGERELAKQIEQLIEGNEFGLSCYNADSRQTFDDVMSIVDHLSKADYYLFIDFKRGGNVPISVFIHQEFALARAWGITEVLAFREKGAPKRGIGIVEYVLTHPIEFERGNLLDLVRENIKKRKWHASYSRNLVASQLITPRRASVYADGLHGTHEEMRTESHCARFWSHFDGYVSICFVSACLVGLVYITLLGAQEAVMPGVLPHSY